jgi:DNA polymerase-1
LEFYKATCATTQEDGKTVNPSLEELLRAEPINYEASRYAEIFYRKIEYEEATYIETGTAILSLWADLITRAQTNDEFRRYMEIEAPVFNLVWSSLSKGICIDRDRLKIHKNDARDEFYLTLRDFAVDFSLPIEIPSESAIERELTARGFDIEGGNRDYILEFLPMRDCFGSRLSELLKIYRTLNALNQLPTSKKLAFPIADISGTRTSRIILRAPSLQNLAKKHRNVIHPREGKRLQYVDYCQFEPGIMAALSGDPQIIRLYQSGDLYKQISQEIFNSVEYRKTAKKLFLSYSYGMSLKKIADAASESGANRKAASEFFRQFSTFEKWKADAVRQYAENGRIGTSLGNYSRRSKQGELSAKEKRSCISQIVQGTGSLIFKKALLALNRELGIAPLIPMHDAILFETSSTRLAAQAVSVMEKVFDEHFEGKIKGKAELSDFAVN